MPKREYVRQIIAFGDYFKEFKKVQPRRVLNKIYQVFLYIMTLQVVPVTFLKRVEGVPVLFEIRMEESGNIYRIFCCMDEDCLVILFNAFQKKTQKTPQRELERAKRIMNEYYKKKEETQYG